MDNNSTIMCPLCGTENNNLGGARTADNFCSECDFPLFHSDLYEPEPAAFSEDARERNPGVGGKLKGSWRNCPACGERNAASDLHCLRCGAVLLLVPDPDTEAANEEVIDLEDLEPPLPPIEGEKSSGLLVGIIAGVLSALPIGYFLGGLIG